MDQPRFITGSLMRHVVTMAGLGAIGLVAVFGVDLLNLFYISLLGERPIAAAVGFCGAVNFFQASLAIGMTIGVGAVVSREIGAGDMADARRVASSSLIVMVAIAAVVGFGTVAALGPILDALGARGETRQLAAQFLTISAPSMPLLAAGMCGSALLRSVGDARGAMSVTLGGAVATAALDPLLIFGLHLRLEGAAISVVVSRTVLTAIAWRLAAGKHDLLGRTDLRAIGADVRQVLTVAGPAILTNLATPVGAAYVTRSMAAFGTAAVAGSAMIDRLTPVAFATIYALSGAVGPIIAQNLGAGRLERVREALRDSLVFILVAVGGAWLLLALGQGLVVRAFSASGQSAMLVRLFCSYLAGSFLFTGMLYVGNAAFNNLGRPLFSTAFNWGRATLGTIPFVTVGAAYGPAGVLVGQAAGSLVFGIAAVLVAFRVTHRLGAEPHVADMGVAIPGSSGGAALATLGLRWMYAHWWRR